VQTDRLTYLVAELHRFAHNGLEARLQEHGSSVEQWRVLETLEGRSGFSMGELANAVLMNHPALTKMIDRMVSNGLVHRAPDPADQRRVLVYGTDRGMALVGRLRPVVRAHEKALDSLLGETVARQIGTILNGVSDALKEHA
jgi:DNA-binding MarR family transcriptional regulator